MVTRPWRVGLVCPYDLDVPGGVREQVLGLAGTLLRSGHEVSVLAPRARGAPSQQLVAGVAVHSAGPALALPTNGSTARLGVGVRARSRAAAWAHGGPDGPFDVVHVHEPIPPGIGHTVLRRLATARERTGERGPAVVATVHVSMSPRPAGRSRSLRTASHHVGSLLGGVDVLTAVSEHARRTLVDHLGRDPLVVPNGVDVAGWASAQPRRAGDAPVVLVLGRADEPRKGVDVLLRAWPKVREQVPRARLVVVGPTRAHLGGGPGVQMAGTVDEADKRALVAGADVLVAPHRGGESFGIVLVEAMATGTPVVASDLPAFRDVLAGTGTLVRPGDPAALAQAVVDVLLATGPTVHERSAAVRRRAAGYDWPVVGAAWAQVYELALDVAGGPGAARARLRRDLRTRAAVASEHAAEGLLAGQPQAPALARAAQAAADPDDLPAQSRLTALVRSGALAGPVADELSRLTDRVAAVRTLVNDGARRHDEPTVELDDDAGGPGASRDSWPWCPSLFGC